MKNMFCTLVLSLFAIPAAMAQSAHDHGRMKDHGTMGQGAAKTAVNPDEFATLDADKDGVLSKAELAKHRLGPHFGMLDANRDGKLSPAEFAAGKGM